MKNTRRWDAASPDVVQNWVSEVTSINEDLRTQGEALRARARDLDWADIQRLVVRSVARDGEIVVRIVRGSEFKIALYDADFLDYQLNRESTKEKNAIIQGIEVDRAGKPIAYYLWNTPPNKVPSIFGMPTKSPNMNNYERVDAEDIIHIYKSDRPNQIRGATWLAPVMIHLLMLNRYEQAEMRRKR